MSCPVPLSGVFGVAIAEVLLIISRAGKKRSLNIAIPFQPNPGCVPVAQISKGIVAVIGVGMLRDCLRGLIADKRGRKD